MDFTEEIEPIEYDEKAETSLKFPSLNIPTNKSTPKELEDITFLSCGVGSKSLHIDKQGLWLGSNNFDEAPFKVGIDGSFNGSVFSATTDVTTILKAVYPVGSIYTSVVSTNPLSIFGFGTWVEFGSGRVLVGKSADTEFDTVEETGGAKTVTLDSTMIPSHLHTVNPPNTVTDSQGSHQHTTGTKEMATSSGSSWTGLRPDGSSSDGTVNNGAAAGAHQHNLDIAEFNSGSTGGGSAHSNIQPYIVVYFWKRTV